MPRPSKHSAGRRTSELRRHSAGRRTCVLATLLALCDLPASARAHKLEHMKCAVCVILRETSAVVGKAAACERLDTHFHRGGDLCEQDIGDFSTCEDRLCSGSAEEYASGGIEAGIQHLDPGRQRSPRKNTQFLGHMFPNDFPSTASTDKLDVRVARGMYSRGENKARISVLSSKLAPFSDMSFFNAGVVQQFKWNWEDTYVASVVVDLPTDEQQALSGEEGALLRISESVSIPYPKLPKKGSGVSGTFLADPCVRFTSVTSLDACSNAGRFQIGSRLPKLLDAFVGRDKETSFWGILGDNFYDRKGDTTKQFHSMLSLETKSKFYFASPGNHDYWVLGEPWAGTTEDQCGNGFVQWNAQDAMSALENEKSVDALAKSPYNLSVNPAAGHTAWKCNPVEKSNTFFYNQIGNIGFIGWSPVYSWEEQKSYFAEACTAFAGDASVEVVLLLNHWNVGGMGAAGNGTADGMAVGDVAERLLHSFAPCSESELGRQNRIKYVTGHTHCSNDNPLGFKGTEEEKKRQMEGLATGVMVGGFGMFDGTAGCGNFGVPIVDTADQRFRVLYFPVMDLSEDMVRASSESGNCVDFQNKPVPCNSCEDRGANCGCPGAKSTAPTTWKFPKLHMLPEPIANPVPNVHDAQSCQAECKKYPDCNFAQFSGGAGQCRLFAKCQQGEGLSAWDELYTVVDRFDPLMKCMAENDSWRDCQHHNGVVVWKDEALLPRGAPEERLPAATAADESSTTEANMIFA